MASIMVWSTAEAAAYFWLPVLWRLFIINALIIMT